MWQSLHDSAIFLRECGGRFETTGSVIPSSSHLAKAVTRRIAARGDAPIRVLECGPGTGAFTNQIVRHLRSRDTFDLVELNATFVDILRRRFDTEPTWKSLATLTRIHHTPFEDFVAEGPYDFIVSGLPHINFPTRLVEKITQCYSRWLSLGGTLSYFEYMYIRPIRTVATLGIDRHRVREVDRLMSSHLARHRACRESVYLNVPPAWVRHLTPMPPPGSGD